MNKIKPGILHQRWVHSREEDTATELVFRPATFNFPRARGRTSFELKPDGSLVEYGIGPTDRRQITQGTWKLKDDEKLTFQRGLPADSHQVLRILSADKDRLVIKK